MSTRHIRFLCGRRTLLSSLSTSAPVHARGRCPASTAAAVHESSDPSAQRTHQSEDLKPFSAIPGPKPLPLLRNLLQFKRNSSRLNPYLEECYNKYGEIFKLEAPGSNNFVYLTDPCCLENILRAEGKYPRRDINMTPNTEWLLTDMGYPITIGFRSGEDWKKARSAINTQIKPSNVQVFTPGLNGVAIRFTDYLKSARDEDNRISDITKLLRRLLVEMSAKFIYNTDVDALVNPTEETERFIEGVTLQFDCYSRLVVDPPIYKIYHNKLYRDFRKAYKIMKDYSLKHARMVEEMFKAGVENEVQGLLERWLRGGKMTDAEAMMASIDMFGAGVDTTSNQAAFLLYYMAKNPETQEKLYQEIQSVLGDCTEPTPEDISKMPYLKGCMMESFRMQSTAEINIRVLAEDTALMGYHIPAETNFVYLNFLTAKNEQYFPNPERFDPARWARDKPNPFAVLPFGFGPRSCYGRRFAELELKLILLQVTRQFILGTELEKLEVEYSLLTRPAGNLPFYLKDRY